MEEKSKKSCNFWWLSNFILVIREAKYKNDCIENTKKGIINVWKNEKVEKNIEEKSGLTLEEFAKIEAYRNCNHVK